MQLSKFFNLGVLDPKESPRAQKASKFFDFIMLLVMFWLPFQWYSGFQGILTAKFLNIANWVVWGLFVAETLTMIILVKQKALYLVTNWLNILIIIIVFPPLFVQNTTYIALLRYLRFIVLLRLILPQLSKAHRLLSRNHFGLTLTIFLLVTLLSGLLVTYIDPQIGGIGKGIWWALETVTTVGYGDVVPNTGAGKLFGALLMLIGVALFSLVSANLAAHFIERGQRQKRQKPEQKTHEYFLDLHHRLTVLEANIRTLSEKLDQLLSAKKKDK